MKKVQIGIGGYGFIGKMHSIAYTTMGISTPISLKPVLRALYSTSVREDEDFEYVTDRFDTLVKDANLDLIDICTPDFMHYDEGMLAMQHNKHVYIEKPIGQTIAQAKELALFAEGRGLINEAALVMRFQPKVVAARDFIRDGGMGEIINFKAKILNKSYLDPNRLVNWRLRSDLAAGGSLMDTGVHVADLVRFLLGEVKSVKCRTSVFFKERFTDSSHTEKLPMSNDEWSFMELKLENGVKGELETSRIAAGVQNRNYIEIFGSKAYMYIDLLTTGFLKIYQHETGREMTGPMSSDSDFAKHLASIQPSPMYDMGCMVDTHSACAMNMLYNIRAGEIVFPETPTLKEAYLSQAVIEMGYRSAADGSREVKREEVL